MVSAELKGDRFLIKFKGKKNQFNEYINKVMSLPDKEWNLQEKCWSIPRSSLGFLEARFKEIDFLDEVKQEKPKQSVKGFEEMPKKMKLTPYD